MSIQDHRHHILVGVDDSDGSRAAIAWAAAAAAAQRWPLTLVHAYPEPHSLLRIGLSSDAGQRADSGQVLDRAESWLESTGWTGEPPARISESATAEHLLRQYSADAHMVVVGRRGTGGFHDLLVGSTAYGVGERCQVPVVIVPETWDADQAAGRPVVLGLDSTSGDEAISFAYEMAAVTSRRLDAVHICPPPISPYLGGVGYVSVADAWPTKSDEWVHEERLRLSEQIAGWGEKYPDVNVRQCVELGSPTGALLGRAADASLLVVGGKDHGRLGATLLGSLARNLIHHATCTLAVVHSGS